MNLSVILIEIIIMLIGFGTIVMGMLLINPLTFISDYPPEIQQEYYRSQHRESSKEKLTKLMLVKKLLAVIGFLFLFAWLLHLADVQTYWQGVGLCYVYLLCIFAWDTFFLDWVLFANIKRIRLPGTEHMEEAYHQKWFHVKVCLPVVPFAILMGFVSSGLMLWIW